MSTVTIDTKLRGGWVFVSSVSATSPGIGRESGRGLAYDALGEGCIAFDLGQDVEHSVASRPGEQHDEL